LLGPGRNLLVNGAGGGVGSLALQLAKACGAHVTGVDSSGKQALMRSLGADAVIDYTQKDFTRRGVRYDLIVDVPGTRRFADFKPALKPDGRYIPIGHEGYGRSGTRAFGLLPHFVRLMFLARFVPQLRGRRVPPPGKRETTTRLRQLLEERTITPVIDSTYPLDQTRAALRHMVEDELHGKVVITID
jgi:NADPH:quinone reductase-like Zn-dependent oxidoreductase